MIDPLKKPTGSRWRNSWHRYAEFLRENGRRPVHERYKERSLYVWYSNNRSKLDNGLLYQELVPSFLKLTDEGDTYRFYVVNRETNIQRLAFLGSENNISGSEVNDDRKVSFFDACKMYVDFCNRLERPPLMEIKEEMEITQWFFKANDDFSNNKLTDQEKHAFDQLLQSTKQYRNENIINHLSRLTEGVPNQKGRNEVLYANNGTKVHVGAWERRWLEMLDRYSKYLDDNKKVPTDNSDLQLYQWLLRQRKLLAAGSLKESRKAELDKLLLKIDEIRRNYPQKPNVGVVKERNLQKMISNHQAYLNPCVIMLNKMTCGTRSGRRTRISW